VMGFTILLPKNPVFAEKDSAFSTDPNLLLERMVRFIAAGLRAPAGKEGSQ